MVLGMWIEVRTKETARDVRKEGLQQAIKDDLGLKAELLETSDIYAIEGSYSTKEAELIGRAMSDKIVQDFSINSQLYSKGAWVVVVRYKPQITDPVEQSVLKLVEDLGLAAHSATMMQKYVIRNAAENDVKRLCEGLLANENTQQYGYGFETVNVKAFLTTEAMAAATASAAEKEEEPVSTIKITKTSDKELRKVSEQNTLSLSLEEMQAIKAYFAKLGRNP
ncbi:MAG: phosphoribosylformylglycinamidine synthase subunit PurS, partial [Nanoarchaeota archaeon]